MVEIRIAKKLVGANAPVAAALRALYAERRVFAVNVLGSPGAGKTALLEALASRLKGVFRIGVIEGDLETARDAERMERAGVKALQITTGRGCHLNAAMVQDALGAFDLAALDLLFVENVGNLVCPADWDLGEDERLLVASVTEGDDKPAKYPPMFASAHLLAMNKTDLLPHVDFDAERFTAEARSLRPGIEVFRVSCRTGEGVQALADRFAARVRAKRAGGDRGTGNRK
ncbi:MAG: hydrogenase nickel incorporation protein HypB [Planctomycetes bacterium]|jgi:hydrogenase nickel incorporation protein HypB|nr:hydrogenase nickel incorporation protein HypB [Planctomycetota bacterium]